VTHRVLVTDYAWPSLATERDALGKIGAELVEASTGEEEELQALAPQADAILTNWKPVSAKTIAKALKCSIISRYGVGVDNIDVETATNHGIVVTNVPDYCMDEVSTEAMALLLCGARRIMIYDRQIREGGWDMRAGLPFPRLWGLTLGIIGFGRIGRTVAPKAQAFGLRVIAYDPYIDRQEMVKRNVTPTDFDTLLRESDFVTLHVPLTPETTKMIGEKTLGKMKPAAWLINTSRGGVVDTEALVVALKKGRIAGAGLDVMPQEPPAVDDPLRSLPNVVMTPHSAFYSEGSLQELQAKAVKRIVDVLAGNTPEHIINSSVLKQDNCRLKRH
jgi:D-3-phosphoglycerate dehydrogenase / 2-oxoglutarate reductase